MKVIVAGTRSIDEEWLVRETVRDSGFKVTELVCGMGPGVDMVAHRIVTDAAGKVSEFPADWSKHGKAAGPIRNRQMAEYADALVAIWDAKSPGTKNMIFEMRALNKPCYVRLVSQP